MTRLVIDISDKMKKLHYPDSLFEQYQTSGLLIEAGIETVQADGA